MEVKRSLHGRIFRLAIPNILSNITIPLLGMVDLALAGHLHDTTAIGAIAISTTLFALIYWSFGFLRMGTTGLTAQALGAGEKKVLGRTLSQSLFIGLIASLVILILQIPIREIALRALNPQASLIPYTHTYYNIVIWGAPAIMCTYALNGWIIGMQNTWWPMIVSITTNVINIIVSASLVIWGKMGIAGIATGTLVAQWVGVTMLALGAYFLFLRKEHIRLSYHFQELRVGLRRYFGTNIHILLRTLLLALVSAFFTYAGTQLGPLPLAANALLYQFFNFFSYFIDGFAYAAEAVVGHSYGRKDRAGMRQVIRIILVWGTGIAITVSIIYYFGGRSFLRMLSDQDDVLDFARDYLKWVYILPLTGYLAFILDGVFVGLTATKQMLLSMAAAVGVFFILFYGVPTEHPNDALWFAFVSYLLVRGIGQLVLLRRIKGVGTPFTYTYYVSIGSTIQGSESKITGLLNDYFPSGILSSFTQSTDITGKSEKVYTNAVMKVDSELETTQLSSVLKKIENEAGRDRSSDEVALDLDVVTRDHEILRRKDYERSYFSKGYHELGGESLV